MRLFHDRRKKSFRRKLRNDSTQPEKIFWQILRKRNCEGIKFRRQCSIGPYIIDFYSFEKKLAIEIDGDSRYTEIAQNYDSKRARFLNQQGITVVRFTNAEVMENLEGCYEVLRQFLKTGEISGCLSSYYSADPLSLPLRGGE